MVSLDPEISNLLWVWVSSEVPSGPGCASTSANVLKKKWKTLDIQNGSKNRISNSTFFGTSPYEFLSYRHVKALNNITLWISFNPSDAESEPQSIKIWISFSEVSKFLYRNIFRNMSLLSGTFARLQESIALVVKIFERICWNFIVMLLPRPRSYCPYSVFRYRCACANIHGIKGVRVLLLFFLLLLFSFLFWLLLR